MKARGAAIQGTLAAVGLVAAYVTWQRPPEQLSQGDVVVLDLRASEVRKIAFRNESRFIEVEKSYDSSPPVVWIRQGPTEEALAAQLGAAADAGTPDAGVSDGGTDGGSVSMASHHPPPPPPEPEKPKTLRGNERAEKVLERFAPLKAPRALGKLSPEKLKELWLDGSKRRLEVVTSSGTRPFTVSSSPVGFSPYAKDEATGNVYLMPGTLMMDLDPSSQMLVDRRLHAFKASEYDGFTVTVGDLKKEYVQQGGDVPQTTQIAPKATPDKPDEFVRNWHDKVWSRLIVTDLLSKGEQPKSGEPKVELRIDYTWKGKPKGWLEVARGPNNEIWARSENTASWVTLHAAGSDEVLAEAKKVAGGN